MRADQVLLQLPDVTRRDPGLAERAEARVHPVDTRPVIARGRDGVDRGTGPHHLDPRFRVERHGAAPAGDVFQGLERQGATDENRRNRRRHGPKYLDRTRGSTVSSRADFLMRRTIVLAAVLSASLLPLPGRAFADDVPTDLSRLVLDTGRIPLTPAEPGVIRFEIHGEEQIRVEGLRSFLLDPTATAVKNYQGGALVGDSIGQNYFLSHWLRLTPTLQITDKLTIVGQADLTGLLAGQTTHDVGADQTPRNNVTDGYENVQPRWLYVDWLTPVGLLRAGQQPS